MANSGYLYKLLPLSICFLCFIFVHEQFKTVESVSKDADSELFSAGRAFDFLSRILEDQQPHPVGSKANYSVGTRIIETMRQLGYQEEIQQHEICVDSSNGSAKCALVRNIIFRIDSHNHLTASSKTLLLSAHYDSVAAAHGASDAGTAVASLVEVARLLSSSPQPHNDIVLLFNDGEEAGLMGARSFMKEYNQNSKIFAVLNIDAIGSSGRSLLIETGESSSALVKTFAKVSNRPIASSFIAHLWQIMPSDTDMTIFKKYGLPGLNFINLEGAYHYHTPLDNLQNVDLGSLQEHGSHLWSLVSHLKDQSIEQSSASNSEHLVYTDIIGLGLIYWPAWAALWIALILLSIQSAVIRSQFKNSAALIANAAKSITAIGVFLILASLSAAMLKKIMQLIAGIFHQSNEPWFSSFLPTQIILFLGIILLGFIFINLVKRHLNSDMFLLFVPWVLSAISVILSIVAVDIAPTFIIASTVSIFVSTPLLLKSLRDKSLKRRTNYLHFVRLLLLPISLICFLPMVYLLEVLMNFYMSPLIGLLIGLSILPFLAFNLSSETIDIPVKKSIFPNDKILIASLLLLGFFWLVIRPIYTPSSPDTLTIQYYQNDNSEAFILVGGKNQTIPKELSEHLNKKGNIILAKTLPWSASHYQQLTTESLSMDSPALNILSSTETNDGRVIEISIQGNQRDLTDLKLFIPIESKLRMLKTKNNIIKYEHDVIGKRSHFGFHCVGLSCNELKLTLYFASNQPSKIRLVSISKGLPQALISAKILRGKLMVEKGRGDRSVITRVYDL